MKHYFVIALAAMAWALPGIPMETRGQADGGRSASHVLVDVEFSGGNALGYIEALRAASGEVNIVVDSPEAVAGVSMAAVKLASVQLSAALELLKDREGQSPDGRNLILDVKTRQVDRGGSRGLFGNPLYQVSCSFYGSMFEDSAEEISGVWTVADLLASQMESSDMLTAIESALELFSDRTKPPEMRFHEPTGLLIARGEEEQLEVIDNIIDELRNTIALRREAAEFSVDGFIDLAIPSIRELEEMLRQIGTATTADKIGLGFMSGFVTADLESKMRKIDRESERLQDRIQERLKKVLQLAGELKDEESVDKETSKGKTE